VQQAVREIQVALDKQDGMVLLDQLETLDVVVGRVEQVLLDRQVPVDQQDLLGQLDLWVLLVSQDDQERLADQVQLELLEAQDNVDKLAGVELQDLKVTPVQLVIVGHKGTQVLVVLLDAMV
jgi:hypothetical protein